MIKDLKSSLNNETINPNIVSDNIPSGAITTPKISNNAVTGDKILDGAVKTSKIEDNAVTGAKVSDGAVTTGKIANSSITTDKIVDSAITSSKISDNAVTGAKINDGAITTNKVNDGAITTSKIEDGAVTIGKIANASINADKIVNASITTIKINGGAVTNTKIANASITQDKMGFHLYEHNIMCASNSDYRNASIVVNFTILSTDDTPLTASNAIARLLYGRGIDSSNPLTASGRYNDDSFEFVKSVDFDNSSTDTGYCETLVISVYGNAEEELMMNVVSLLEGEAHPVSYVNTPGNLIVDNVSMIF